MATTPTGSGTQASLVSVLTVSVPPGWPPHHRSGDAGESCQRVGPDGFGAGAIGEL